MSKEIRKADPAKQRLLFMFLVLSLMLGVWSVLRLESQLDAARSKSLKSVSDAAGETLEIATAYFQIFGGILALFGVYLVILGLRIWRHGLFPPPKAWILRDTEVMRGSAARLRASLAWFFGALMIVVGLWVPGWAEAQLDHVLKGALQTPDPPPSEYLPQVE